MITVAYTTFGGSSICATAAELQPVVLDCASVGAEGVITDIKFASYGIDSVNKHITNTSCRITTWSVWTLRSKF